MVDFLGSKGFASEVIVGVRWLEFKAPFILFYFSTSIVPSKPFSNIIIQSADHSGLPSDAVLLRS